jgi:signal transduction histidine kinase
MAVRIRYWTLRAKVVLHVIVLGILSAAIVAFLYFSTQRGVLHTFIRREAELVGSLIENNVFLLKKCGRVQDTQAEIHDLVALSEAVQSIRILTVDGRIFASTRPADVGTLIPAADAAVLKAMLDGTARPRVFRDSAPSVIRSLSLIANAPACYQCHDQGQRINGFLEVDFNYQEASSLLWQSQWRGIVLALVALAGLTAIILRLFHRLINRPITELKDGMKKLQQGDLSVRFAPKKLDEIGRLMVSFNGMAEDLEKANAEIQRLYQQRVEKAEHLAAFGELAAGLAHEVKNPLSGMRGALEVIEQKTPAGSPQKEIFGEIIVQIDKLIAIIQDFLSYARPKPLKFQEASPNPFVENAVRLAKTQLGGKDIAFHLSLAGDDVRLPVDADRMQEVLLNLLLNSIAAIQGNGNIHISVRTDAPAGTLDITVADDGTGIKESNLDQVFHPFFSTKNEGTGLGLSISKKTVDAHGGTIAVESREGRGTTFTIRLPLSRPRNDHVSQEDPDRR